MLMALRTPRLPCNGPAVFDDISLPGLSTSSPSSQSHNQIYTAKTIMSSLIAMGHQKVNMYDDNNQLTYIDVKTETKIIVDDWCNADHLSADFLSTDKRTVTIERRAPFYWDSNHASWYCCGWWGQALLRWW